jgi:hypothetical protein
MLSAASASAWRELYDKLRKPREKRDDNRENNMSWRDMYHHNISYLNSKDEHRGREGEKLTQ